LYEQYRGGTRVYELEREDIFVIDLEKKEKDGMAAKLHAYGKVERHNLH
jgi:hypothetical protein